MIEERALVLSTFKPPQSLEDIALVKVQRTSSCESCSLKSGCGQSTLTKMSGEHCLELEVSNDLDAREGDEVLIAIPESGLISASLRVYFIPLVFMLLGALIGDVINPETEFWTATLGVSGLAAGFFWARVFSQKHALHENYQPKMIKVVARASMPQNLSIQ